jgi:hypothetical protein
VKDIARTAQRAVPTKLGKARHFLIHTFAMRRLILPVLLLCSVSVASLAEDEDSPNEFLSPDGRFDLRIASPSGSAETRAELFEKVSGKTMVDLGVPYRRQLLVWSADSKWVAYCNRGDKSGDLTVYFWNGTAFDNIELPEDLPSPHLKIPKGTGGVKNYGGAVEPLRWSKPGELQLASDAMMLGRDNGVTYTGVVRFTLAFDAQHHVSIKNIGKTKTKMSR